MTETTTTGSDYADRIDRVIQWLVDHLDDSLGAASAGRDHLAHLAEVDEPVIAIA